MDLVAATALGAAGGGIAELVSLWGNLAAWQKVRHAARLSRRNLPALTKYIDPAADALVGLTRVAFGAGAGALFHTGVTGTYAAIAVGASAPALLAQVGAARSAHEAQAAPKVNG